ncbi:MAG: ABC transporter ATP-binding protein [Nitriliruptoraceae bacterium]
MSPGAELDAAPSSTNGSAPMANPKIEIRELTKIYESATEPVHALERITESVAEGEFVAIVGASGCGKTTLLWGMSGLHPITSGSVVLDGEPITRPVPDRIGMVFQDATLLPWRTLQSNIEFPFEIKKVTPDQDRIAELIEIAGLTGFEDAFPPELSGGMRQRASIVRALAQDPEVLLMDEPFGALDAFTRDEMNLLLLQLWEAAKKTVVFVTHSINEAVFLADRIWVLTPRPGRLARVYDVPFDRPRDLDLHYDPDFIQLTRDIKADVQGDTPEGAGA